MRFVKYAIAALTALAAMGGSACALDVNKKIAAPAQVLTVWSTISDFCSIKDWHPAIVDCKKSKEGSDTFRVLTLKDNGGSIKEKLTGTDDTSYSYEIVESLLPVKNYSAKLWVEPDERDPGRTVIREHKAAVRTEIVRLLADEKSCHNWTRLVEVVQSEISVAAPVTITICI